MDFLQSTVELKGLEIFRKLPDESVRITDRRWWADKLMKFAMEDTELKIRLFRFIDVFPTFTSTEQAAEHIRQYFLSGDLHLPPLLEKFLRGATSGITAGVTIALVRKNLEAVARTFIAEETPVRALPVLKKLRSRGREFTIDILGEAALSEREAKEYQKAYLELINLLASESPSWGEPTLERQELFPRLNVSVKVSSLFSRIGPTNYEESIDTVKERLRPLFRRVREVGGFVNLDMEMFALKEITLDVFRQLLEEEEFTGWNGAEIAIQAYLKDSRADLEKLIAWAANRQRTITVRLVKGAYWEYEQVTARQKGWPVPVYHHKGETDANFEACLEVMFANNRTVIPAVGSHNIRSIAAAMALAEHYRVPSERYEFQMLYGMAEPVKESLRRLGFPVREYVPVGPLIPGMAYLVRRLLENTSNESFLRKTFTEHTSPAQLLARPKVTTAVAREVAPPPSAIPDFSNEPVLDLSIREKREAYKEAIEAVRNELGQEYPIIIGGKEYRSESWIVSTNPANPQEEAGRVVALTPELADLAVKEAVLAQGAWGRRPARERAEALFKAADIARTRRLKLAAWQILETGKSWSEADADVCEAIDYLEYYGREMLRLGEPRLLGPIPGEENQYHYWPRGVAAVIAPWNFPLAISAGMASAAIVAGNAVLYKPSSLSPVNGWQLYCIFRDAGLPPGVFNYIPGKGEVAGNSIISHPQVSLVAFTGSRDVGFSIMERAAKVVPGQRDVKRVVAEMGGKNAIIVDADADLDQTVSGVMHSAFSYHGQKCSACSRVIVLASCYDRFVQRLSEAVRDMPVGPTEDPANIMGPLIEPRAVERLRAAVAMATREGKVVAEGTAPDGGQYFPPVVVTDLPLNSPILKEELFGPLLAVVKAKDLSEAISIVNDSEYALTGGLYSRSPLSIERVAAEFVAGNLYINRPITGAIVGRQPFGGLRLSGVGSKAGGPDYLLQFMEPRVVTENTMRRGFTPELIA